MLNRTHAIVELSPTQVEVAVYAGRTRRAAAAQPVDAADWSQGAGWLRCLDAIEAALASCVERLACQALPAHLVVWTPTGQCATAATPVEAGGPSSAADAAMLALAAAAPFDAQSHPHDVTPLGVEDRSSAARVASAGSIDAPPRQRHAIAVADLDETLDDLFSVVERAGLRPMTSTPAEAVGARAVVRDLLARHRNHSVNSCSAVLWVGDHVSVLGAAHQGRVLFIRSIALGAWPFASALTRPIRAAGESGGDGVPVDLTIEQARELLLRHGVPPPGERLTAGGRQFSGAAVLPLLQPLLQRLSVEAKHSVRFGVPEAARAGMTFRTIGPAGDLPGLAVWIARACGLVHEPPSQTAPSAGRTADSPPGLTGDWAAQRLPGPHLLPSRWAASSERRSLRRTLAIGGAIAAFIVAADAGWSWRQLSADHQRLSVLEDAGRTSAEHVQHRDLAASARLALGSLEERIDARMGLTPEWGGLLLELAGITPPEIKLTAVNITAADPEAAGGSAPGTPSNRPRSRGQVTGFVLADHVPDLAGALADYVDALRASPVLVGVRLERVRQAPVDGRETLHFTLEFLPVELPATPWSRAALPRLAATTSTEAAP